MFDVVELITGKESDEVERAFKRCLDNENSVPDVGRSAELSAPILGHALFNCLLTTRIWSRKMLPEL